MEVEQVKYITKDKDNNFLVNVAYLSTLKEEIILRYEKENLSKLQMNSVDYLKEFSSISDRYLLNIIEEMMEFYEAFMINKINEETLYELIDVIGYVCSLIHILDNQLFCNEIDTDKFYDNEINTTITVMKELPNDEDKTILINTIITSLYQLMMKYRREFKERKWHKKIDRKFSINHLNLFFSNLKSILLQVLGINIQLFLVFTDSNYELFNEMISKKNFNVLSNSDKE